MESEEQEYFHSIEDAFIELRGAPLLLSPTDWQLAMEWRRKGIPASFVITSLREVFAKRVESGSDRRVSTLRFCKRKVEGDWKEIAELLGPGTRSGGATLNVEARLEDLGAALPGVWQSRLGERVRSLRGAPEADVETALEKIDEEMLQRASAELSAEDRAAVEKRAARRLESVAGRLDGGELRSLRRKIEREEVRRAVDLPYLSLFSSLLGH